MQKQNHNRIEQAQNKWIQRLTDLSRRNNLVYYRELKNGTIELIDVNIQAFDELLLGKPVSANDLFPNKCNEIHFKQQVLIYTIMLFSFSGLYKLILPIIKDYPEINREINTEVIKKIQNIYKRSISNLEERGLRTLFLAYGMVTWTANDGGRNPQAPLVLIPISIQTKGEIKLIRSGEAQINPVLLYFLEKEYGYQITSEQLLNGDSDIPENEVPDLQNIADKFTNIIKNIPSFTIDQSRAILSNFAFQKMSMVRDLRDNFRVLSDNKLILALAGDVSSQQSLRGNSYDDILNNTSKLDQIKPDDEFLVFDADSSQQRVIYTALKGNNIVIQGPPGTGKSQTIANLIVSFAAQGKKVLFVAEKRAALEVVKKRLEQKDLGHLLLDLHGSDISRKLVMEQIAESLTLIRNSSPINTDLIHNNFIDKRNNLNNHVRLIHIKRQPYQKSVYELQAEILFFQDKPELQCLTRFRGHILEKITSNLSQIENLLTQLMSPNLLPLFLEETSSPWLKINFSSREDAIKIGDLVTKINQILRLNILDPVFSISLEYGINSVKNIQDIISLIEISDKINNFYSLYNADLFDHNLQEYLQILYPLQNYEDARKFDTIIYLLNSGSDLCSDQFMQKLDDFIKLSSEINRTLSIYNEKIFKEDLETIIKDLSSGDSGFFGILNFFNEKLNNARSKIKKLRFSTDISDQDLIVETKRALEQLRKWTKLFPHKSFPEKIYLLSDNNYQLKEILLSKHFWDVFSDLRKLRYSSSNSINQIIKELEQANELLQQWRLLSSSFLYPQKIIHNQKLKDTLSDLLKDLKLIESKFNNINFINLPLEELENLFKELSDHSELPLLLATLQEIEKNINNCGANDILREFKNTKSDPSLWLKKFRYAWLYSCLEKAYIEEPYLRTFHGKNHNQIVSEFRKLDQERLNIAQLRVKRNHAEKAISTMNKYRSGNLPHRFGPLLYQGGERRLNVAISRARKSMILVSSFSHHDIDLNKTKARGVELLKFYIQYAASGGKLLGDKGISEIPLNPFEQDIFDNLTNQGISLIPQWGVSNYRIDMVAKHPEKPGEFVLAIECDGATYHSSPTARERDRLRQQQLESLGWRFHRIWSIDWFNNKQEEIKRTITAFEEAVQYANNQSIQKSIDHNEQDENLNHNTILNDIKAKIRCPKPNIPEKSYNIQDIIKIVEWILSDGNLPTDEELLKETRSELGFKRSGKKIDDIIRDAIKIVNNKL